MHSSRSHLDGWELEPRIKPAQKSVRSEKSRYVVDY
ncbi:hypothetical protein HALLA_14070 [Halostagnicola larsenii XH-48]|uniref:Uncharacterized protein n=1 Tax=Halostagnicola larsenii XH-48 TaxID=797299 RepID=W0JR12_9EURY|nr:hypothetical protein HALLA_14070 [Halostagnicola larsenii XH-48]